MSSVLIVEFVALAVVLAIAIAALYVVFEMRQVYADQRDKFLRVITAVEESQRLLPEIGSTVVRLESDGNALQEVALQMERMIAEMRMTIVPSLTSAAERQTNVLDDIGDHLDWQKSRLGDVLENISMELRHLGEMRHIPAPLPGPEPKEEYVRIDKDALGSDQSQRFNLIRDWVQLNSLAILHRASKPYSSPGQLIGAMPDYFQAEAEMLEDRVLLIGTRGHSERLALAIRDIESSERFRQWFEFSSEDSSEIPALLARSNGSLDVSQKGTTHRISA